MRPSFYGIARLEAQVKADMSKAVGERLVGRKIGDAYLASFDELREARATIDPDDARLYFRGLSFKIIGGYEKEADLGVAYNPSEVTFSKEFLMEMSGCTASHFDELAAYLGIKSVPSKAISAAIAQLYKVSEQPEILSQCDSLGIGVSKSTKTGSIENVVLGAFMLAEEGIDVMPRLMNYVTTYAQTDPVKAMEIMELLK